MFLIWKKSTSIVLWKGRVKHATDLANVLSPVHPKTAMSADCNS